MEFLVPLKLFAKTVKLADVITHVTHAPDDLVVYK